MLVMRQDRCGSREYRFTCMCHVYLNHQRHLQCTHTRTRTVDFWLRGLGAEEISRGSSSSFLLFSSLFHFFFSSREAAFDPDDNLNNSRVSSCIFKISKKKNNTGVHVNCISYKRDVKKIL